MREDKVLYWSRAPGKTVDKNTGEEIHPQDKFYSIQDWYAGLIELIFDNSSLSQDYLTARKEIVLIFKHSNMYFPPSKKEKKRNPSLEGFLIHNEVKKLILQVSRAENYIEIISNSTFELTTVNILDMG